MMKSKKIAYNIIMLYGMSIAKIIFPLLTLPYLTRILSVECYGVVSYVKAVMQYMQLFVDFGFMLSGTRDIIKAKDDQIQLAREIGDIMLARILLAAVAFCALLLMMCITPILQDNAMYAILAFASVFLTIFLFDYYFRGIEKMQMITVRFVIMRGVSTILTFILVHSDSDIILMPLLDTVGTALAVGLVFFELKRERIRICFTGIRTAWNKVRESFVYFASNMATTVFGALNTLLIGSLLDATDVAYWSVCLQLIAAIQVMYTPITDGIYPEMVRTRNAKLVKRLLLLFMPVVLLGSLIVIVVAPYALLIVGGEQYVVATNLLRMMVPILVFSFPAVILGWPTLGAIDKASDVTKTTILASLVQILGLIILIVLNQFTLLWIAVIRCFTEFVLMTSRVWYCGKYRNEFRDQFD